ncbi:MAG: Hydrogenase 2 maturation protease, partial [Bacteroidota bacterium]
LALEVLPEGVDVVDGGTGGFHLLEYFESYPNVILIDATLDTNLVGTIRKIKPKFSMDFPQAMSTHDIGMKDLVNALQILGTMPIIDLFVVSIESIQQQGIILTPEIEAIIPLLKDRVKELMHELLVTEKVLN